MKKDVIHKAYGDFAVYCLLMGAPSYTLPKHLELLADKLMAVERGEITRLAVFMPPRHGKSMMVSQRFPGWWSGRNPSDQIILATYNQTFSNSWGRKVNADMADNLYQTIFDTKTTSNAVHEITTGSQGVLSFVGRGAGVTGRGANLFIIDDLVKDYEEATSRAVTQSTRDWLLSVMSTRLMKDNAIVLIMTRWAYDDPGGWMLREWAHEGWDVINLPAECDSDLDPLGRDIGQPLWPDMFGTGRLEQIKKTMNADGKGRHWLSLYQQKPMLEGGNLVSVDKISPLEELPKLSKVTLSVDTSMTDKEAADPWGFVLFGSFDNKHVMIESFAKRCGMLDGVDLIVDKIKEHGIKTVLVEEKALGQQVIKQLRKQLSSSSLNCSVIAITEKNTPLTKNKVVRMVDANEVVDGQRVFHYKFGHGIPELLQKLSVFPESDDDHEADAFSQYLNYNKSHSTFIPMGAKRG